MFENKSVRLECFMPKKDNNRNKNIRDTKSRCPMDRLSRAINVMSHSGDAKVLV